MTSRPAVRALPRGRRTSGRGAWTRLFLRVGLLLGVWGWIASPAAAAAPKDHPAKPPAERTVEGSVETRGGAAVPHAVVYLQNTTTQEIRSYVSDASGQYHFRQLSPDVDYQVWAELNGHRSKTRTISQFNSHVQFHFKLKVRA